MSRFKKRKKGMSDERGLVGNLYAGTRTVKKGGVIRFDGVDYHHPILEGWVGERLYILNDGNDCWCSYPVLIFRSRDDIYPRSNKLCEIKQPLNQ